MVENLQDFIMVQNMDKESIREYMIELYERNLVFNNKTVFERYEYTYDKANDDMCLIKVNTSLYNCSNLIILDVFDSIGDGHGNSVLDSNSVVIVLNIGSRVTNIRNAAFSDNYLLKEVIVDNSDRKLDIDIYAFSQCNCLETFKCNRLNNIMSFAFELCHNLCYIDLSTVVLIGYESFRLNNRLQGINLKSIKSLNEKSFSECSSLSYVYLGENLKGLVENIFFGCYNLSRVIIDSKCNECFSFYAFHNHSFSLYLKHYNHILHFATGYLDMIKVLDKSIVID